MHNDLASVRTEFPERILTGGKGSWLVSICVVLVCLGGCSRREAEGEATSDWQPVFADRAAEVGLRFTHTNGGVGELYFVEGVPPGAALLDYDNDGDLDAYLLQGHSLARPGDDPPAEGDLATDLTDRLFRNDLSPGDPESLAFTDVTSESGIRASGYGMGAATGDFDNDGWVDLYVTNFGPNQLWHNNGDGTFSDVTASAQADDERWSTSATFFDFDRDGWLDLYVANYVDYRLASARRCASPAGMHDYCGPLAYDPLPGKLLRNRGDGTFEDASGPAGVLAATANGMGVLAADFDGNGWLDLYVASDQAQNVQWTNQGTGILRNDALMSGSAVNRMGQAEAGMGVAAADFDADGDDDLFVTHLTSETNTFYRNDGRGLFLDETAEAGLGAPSVSFTGFGVAALDFDNDGWLDLAIANGAVLMIESLALAGDAYPYDQRNQLFRNLGGGRFQELDPSEAGLGPAEVSRGLAFGDVDNDGDTDLLLANNNGPARLLINQRGQEQAWIGLRVIDHHGRDALGALVEAQRADGLTLRRRVHTDGSFCSAHDPRVLLGLGENLALVALRVHWPSGEIESFAPPSGGHYAELVQGTGVLVEAK